MVKKFKGEKQKRFKTGYVLLAIFVVIIVAVGYWQRNNIGALFVYISNDEESIQQKLNETEKIIEEELATISDENTTSDKTSNNKSEDNSPTNEKGNSEKNKARIQELIDKVYSMRSYYVSQLDSIHETAMHSFWSLPKEQRTMDTKKQMALGFIDQASALEKNCDGQMDEILSELKMILSEEGQDTSVCNRIARAYAQEKQIKKAELLSILAADPNRK